MRVILSTEAPDLPEHKCLALGIFSDEKPPRGIGGSIDWRLNGFISRGIKQGQISGDFLEKIVIPYPQRIGTEILLLLGLGPREEFNHERVYRCAYQIAATVDGMLLNNFAFDLLGAKRAPLTTASILEAMLTGFFDYLSNNIEKLERMTSCIVAFPDQIKEISSGVRQFKINVKDMGTVDIEALENSFA